MLVTVVAVTTLCGRIEPGGIGSALDRRRLEELRATTDASLLGAGTLRAADPEMRGPGGVLSGKRLRAVVSGSGNLPGSNRRLFVHGPPPLLFTRREHVQRLAALYADRAEVLAVDPTADGALDLWSVIGELARRGARSLLVEGGGGLNHQAFRQGVVNELALTVAPKLSGALGAASLADGLPPLGLPFLEMELLFCEAQPGGELFLRYRVSRAADPARASGGERNLQHLTP